MQSIVGIEQKKIISVDYINYLNNCLECGNHQQIADNLNTTRFYVCQILTGNRGRGVIRDANTKAYKIVKEAKELALQKMNALIRSKLETMWRLDGMDMPTRELPEVNIGVLFERLRDRNNVLQDSPPISLSLFEAP